ncbi:hypothetical protein SY83_19185 [Paenibacillus swuensis]|uniref:Uncharacterized protein n=1 Tax=Paenibacillus swuensis TaxID=1178515 RepID=A0A172TM53_9BACL|nr:hypothetical protein [Paenibacillus swuensis]ANE48062.1 hypothetical protein SY83_19185 [Paenibacillus swuensis]
MRIDGEMFVLVLLALLVLYWLFTRVNQWLETPPKPGVPMDVESFEPEGEAVSILQDTGYEIIHGKKRIPLRVHLDVQTLESRLFIDYFARKEGEVFAVKVAKNRSPVELTGSGLRDGLLIYQLLYEDVDGVLYIDPDAGTLRKIKFEMDTD